MNQALAPMPVPGMTTKANRVNMGRDFPNVYEVRSWAWAGDRGKLRMLRQIAKAAGRDPRLREFTINQVLRPAGVLFPSRQYEAQGAAILRWVQQNIAYVNEPGEQVQGPYYTVSRGFGDCDDMAVLMAAMAESVMLPWRYALAGKGMMGRPVKHFEGGPMPWSGSFSHIYVQIGSPPDRPTKWLSAEPTISGAPLGYDVVDHGIPRSVAMPEMGARAIGPAALGPMHRAPAGRTPMPVMPAPYQRPTHPGPGSWAGYGGTIVGREGYDGWYAEAAPPQLPPAEAAALAASAAKHAAQAAQDAAKAAGHFPPDQRTFWNRIDWHDITAGVVQGVLVSAAIALVAPWAVKQLKGQ